MDRLILFRHGKAEQDSASGDDFDRRLAPRGEQESAVMGARLADLGLMPDVALVSPAARTRGTWAAAQAAFPRAELRVADELYHADAGAIRRTAAAAGTSCGTVMVVGHNPGLQELTVQLLTEGAAEPSLIERAHRFFPTAAAAVFLFDAAGRPQFDGLFFPGPLSMARIYKILPRADWAAAQAAGRFDGSPVDHADGFIHFSTAAQAQETARRHFAGQADLVVLAVDADDLGPALRWEPSRGGDLFPHLYGPLDTAHVRAVTAAPLEAAGVPHVGALG